MDIIWGRGEEVFKEEVKLEFMSYKQKSDLNGQSKERKQGKDNTWNGLETIPKDKVERPQGLTGMVRT